MSLALLEGYSCEASYKREISTYNNYGKMPKWFCCFKLSIQIIWLFCSYQGLFEKKNYKKHNSTRFVIPRKKNENTPFKVHCSK